jgi:SAM-dependent methyltransferase
MEWYEAAFDGLYPVIYKSRDSAEAETVVGSFESFLRGKEPVLDLACGTGRYLEALSRRGFSVYGLDLSHYLLKACVDRWGHGDEIVQGDMRYLPFASGSLGSVINMFTSFGYFSRDTDNLQVFQEVFRVLAPGGVFLFDFINADRITGDLLDESARDEGQYRIKEKRKIEQHGKYLVKTIDVHDLVGNERSRIIERLRLYTKGDLISMFESLGFAILDVFGDYLRNPFMDGVSDRVIVVAAKR